MTVIKAITAIKDYNWHHCHKGYNVAKVTMTIRLMRPTRAMTDTRTTMETRVKVVTRFETEIRATTKCHSMTDHTYQNGYEFYDDFVSQELQGLR